MPGRHTAPCSSAVACLPGKAQQSCACALASSVVRPRSPGQGAGGWAEGSDQAGGQTVCLCVASAGPERPQLPRSGHSIVRNGGGIGLAMPGVPLAVDGRPDDVDRVLPGFFYHVLALRYRESAPHLRRRRSHHRDSRCWFRGSIRQPFSCIHSASCVSEYRCAPSRASRRPGITAPFNARRRGHHRGNVYRIELGSAIVTLATEPGGLTRFRV